MKKITELNSPALAAVIREGDYASAVAEIKNAVYSGADMIDLHLSCLEKTDTAALQNIIASTPIPVLSLNYSFTHTGSPITLTEEERTASLLRAVDAGTAGIDIQGYTFDLRSKEGFFGEDKYSFTRGNPREIVTDEAVIKKQTDLIEKVHEKGSEVLLSCHPGIFMDAETLVELALFLERRNPDIIKIVTAAHSEEELAESFRAMTLLKKEVKTKVAYHASGKAGALSRIVNPLLGSHMIFCVERYKAGSTLEQPDLKAAKAAVDNIKRML